MPTAADTSSAAPNPCPLSMSAQQSDARPTAASTAPIPSSGSCESARDSGTWRTVIATATTASGTLMRNTHRHENASINQPPTNGPTALATPASPAHAPIARPRSTSWNAEPMIARLPGTSSAPAAPWNARAIASTVASDASAHATDASGERHEPGEEDPAAAEAVAERAAEEQERGERDEVRVERPLQTGDVGLQVAADRGQRDVHDRAVEERDARPEHGRRDHPARRRRTEAELAAGRSHSLQSAVRFEARGSPTGRRLTRPNLRRDDPPRSHAPRTPPLRKATP